MSVKKLLGLECTELSEPEIMSKIAEARGHNLEEIDFTCKGQVIKVRIPNITSAFMDAFNY